MAAVPLLAPDLESSKARLFGALGYEIKQEVVKRFHLSTAPHRIVSAPARTSKSYAAAPEAIHEGLPLVDSEHGYKPVHDETHVFLIGVDYATCKEWDYVWGYLEKDEFALIRALNGRVTKAHNSPLAGNMQVVAEWGTAVSGRTARTVWTGKSATNEKSLQGEEVRLAILSEAAEHDLRVVEKYLWTRCKQIIYPTTPKKKALWLYKMILDSEDPALGIEHFLFTAECNPTYDKERREQARARSIATYGDYHEDDEYMEQFEGEWRFAEGRVLPFVWIEDGRRSSNIAHGAHPDWFDQALYVVSCDYGYTDPAVALFWAIGPEGQLLIFDEVYERLLSSPKFVERVRQKEEKHGLKVRQWIPDPQQPGHTRVMRDAGLPVWASQDKKWATDRAAGFKNLIDALSIDPYVGEPRLRVHERCERTIHEWKALRRKDNALDEFSSGSLMGRDDAADAARYGIQAIGRRKAPVTRESWVEKVTQAYRESSYRELLARQGAPLIERRVA